MSRELRRLLDARVVVGIDVHPPIVAVAAGAAAEAIELLGRGIGGGHAKLLARDRDWYTSASMSEGGSFALSLLAIGETFVISAPTVYEALRGSPTSRARCSERLERWSKRIVRQAEIDLRVHGSEHLVAGETYVVMSNHQSLWDIPVLFRALPSLCLRMVAKTELFRIPVFGGALEVAEFIELDRGNKNRARQSLKVAQERFKSGISVWIAPEGTRSPTGKLGSFKKGGFILALEAGARILPVTLVGTGEVMPARATHTRKGKRVDAYIHAPIDAKPYGIERRDELVSVVKSAIESALPPHMQG